MKILVLALAVSSFAIAGCMEEDSSELGDTEQSLFTPTTTWHTCPAGGVCSNISLGAADVCMITKLDGDFAHAGGARLRQGFAKAWLLDIGSPAANNGIQVGTQCFNWWAARNTSPAMLVAWSSQSQSNPVFHGTASTHCFLSQVWNNDTDKAFFSFDGTDYTTFRIVNQFGHDFEILGEFPPTSNVTIGMVCFAANTDLGGVAYANGTGQFQSNIIVPYDNHNFNQAIACGLTGVGGVFTTPSTTNGIAVALADGKWGWEASNLTTIYAECVQ